MELRIAFCFEMLGRATAQSFISRILSRMGAEATVVVGTVQNFSDLLANWVRDSKGYPSRLRLTALPSDTSDGDPLVAPHEQDLNWDWPLF